MYPFKGPCKGIIMQERKNYDNQKIKSFLIFIVSQMRVLWLSKVGRLNIQFRDFLQKLQRVIRSVIGPPLVPRYILGLFKSWKDIKMMSK